jgi:hypothetical protein
MVHRRVAAFLAIVLSVILSACGTPTRPGGPAVTSALIHEYQVKVVDVNGAPLEGVLVKQKGESKHSLQRNDDCTTNAQGLCPGFRYAVTRDPTSYSGFYYSSFAALAEKHGYYPGVGRGYSSYGSVASSTPAQLQTVTLRMVKPLDYLDPSFAASSTERELRERVLRFLDVLRVQGVLTDSEVMLKGIGVSEFKGQKYLRVKINTTNVYNSLKLSKYDVGKQVFDDTVRKMLNPLNDAIAAPRSFHGYDLVVYGHRKSFLDKLASPDKLEFRFLMPESAVRKYKDKDISGQSLLDASVILLDDERIDMKLQ